jgi:hypothetical protein
VPSTRVAVRSRAVRSRAMDRFGKEVLQVLEPQLTMLRESRKVKRRRTGDILFSKAGIEKVFTGVIPCFLVACASWVWT